MKFFPLTLDKLSRERAFFSGRKLLLLGAMHWGDVSTLLRGGQGEAGGTEFGAHQVKAWTMTWVF